MKKRFVIMLIFTLVMQAVSLTAGTYKVYAEVCPGWEYDTDGGAILIDSALELSCIRGNLNGNYKLTKDIDLEGYDYDGDGKGWMPIGGSTASFAGTLDGNGYAIRNMTINRPLESRVGLFGRIAGTNAKLINIRLLDIHVTGESVALSSAAVGGLAGNLGDGTIENSYATGSVSVSGPDSAAGGLVGVNASGTIQNSYAVVHVVGAERVGGLVGTNADTIQNSYAAGNVKGIKGIGGLVGYNVNASGTIKNSYAVGDVSGNDNLGGLVGNQESGATTLNSFWNTETTGQFSSAGSPVENGRTTEEMKDPNNFSDEWDAEWDFRVGETYPYLRSFHMGIGVDPLAATTYNLDHGQDALSVTGSVYREASGEPITVKYVIRDRSNVTVTEATYITTDDNSTPSIDRRFSLAGWSNDDYTLTITAEDTRNTVVGAMLAFTVDNTASSPPSISFETNGSETWTQSASTSVTVTNSGGGVDEDSLQYAWSADTVTPFSGWTPFTDDQVLSKSGTNGDWYLHIRVEDDSGNPANVVSNRFRLDNLAPTLSIISQVPGSDKLTSEPVTVTAASDGTGSDIAEMRWADGVRSADYFASGGTLFTGSSFQVATNGAYTVYAEDQAGNGAVETVDIDNIISDLPQIDLTYSPATVTNGLVVVTATAAVYGDTNSLTKLNWLPGSHSPADFSGGTVGDDILNEREFSVTTNGTYTVYAKDAAGNEAVEEIEITNIATTSPETDEDDDDSDRNNEPAAASAPVITEAPNGGITLVIESSNIVKETLEDGTVIEKVMLTDEIIERVLESLEKAENPFVTIVIDDTEQAVQVGFPAASLRKAREAFSDAVFEVMTNGASFQLQIDVLDLEGLAEQLGVDVQQTQVNVVIKQVAGQAKEQLEQIAGKQGLKLVGQAVDYKVTVSAGERTVEIQDFGGTYMVRAIVLDENLSGHSLIAVLYEPAEQTLSFVPGVVSTRNEARREMSLRVPHNSIYAIMEASNKSFADLNGHWAKQDVELMASKLIVQGVSDIRFAPDDRITRAEFTALLVRALGIRVEGQIENPTFRDVSRDVWYAPAIEAGVDAGLVDGISEGRFAPNSEITREQMTFMIANAMSIAGKPAMDSDQTANILDKFADQSEISAWARLAVAQSVSAGIIDGVTENTMAPSEQATRAQAAVMLKRFLQYVEFID